MFIGGVMLGSIVNKVLDFIPKPEDKAKVEQILNNELTERLKADMQSDSWLSKNIRPMSLIFLLVLFATQVYVKNGDLAITSTLLKTVFSFYFGSRGLEKAFTIFKGGKT